MSVPTAGTRVPLSCTHVCILLKINSLRPGEALRKEAGFPIRQPDNFIQSAQQVPALSALCMRQAAARLFFGFINTYVHLLVLLYRLRRGKVNGLGAISAFVQFLTSLYVQSCQQHRGFFGAKFAFCFKTLFFPFGLAHRKSAALPQREGGAGVPFIPVPVRDQAAYAAAEAPAMRPQAKQLARVKPM